MGVEELRGYVRSLKNMKSFMVSGEALIELEEEEIDPVEVLGMKAESSVLNSILGLFVTVLLFAWEGYSNSGCGYDEKGYFVPVEEES